MSEMDNFKINARSVKAAPLHRTFHLDDEFFHNLKQDEIKGGDINAELTLRHIGTDTYEAAYAIHGTVTVTCDRCLDDLVLPVAVEETRILKDDPAAREATDERITLLDGGHYDAAWELYELIELSLPLQRVHDVNDCDPDVVSRLHATDDEA